MNRSESIGKLAPALLAAQRSLKPVLKDSENPHFRSKYAGLPAILEAARAALNAQGIAVVQGTLPSEPGTLTVLTMLLHESGEYLEDALTLRLSKDDPQGAGSGYTYGRRYALQALIGLAAEDDDDGNAASGPPRPPNADSKAPAPRQAPPAPKAADWRGTMLAAVKGNVGRAAELIGEVWIVPEGASAEDMVAILEGADDSKRREIYRKLAKKEG